jgi:hypothetical protein
MTLSSAPPESAVPEQEHPPTAKGQMLPGIAAICLFMIFMTMINVFADLRGAFGSGVSQYGILALCTLLAIGIFGLLRLTKWGWALVTAGCLLFASGDFYFFSRTHIAFFFVRGLFVLLFFLYLIRPETRDRLH